MDHVIIEKETESTIMFVEGAKRAYLGYVTLKVLTYILLYFLSSMSIL